MSGTASATAGSASCQYTLKPLPSTIVFKNLHIVAGFPAVGSTMGNTSRILQRLYSLDISSPDFLRYLHCLIQHDEEERYLTNLKEPELTRLLDFLDKVRAIPPNFRQLRDIPLQALDTIPTTDDVVPECLEKLQAICADRCTLPSSCIISDELVRVDGSPIIIDDGCGLWKGTYCDKDVYVISSDIPVEGYGKKTKVRTRRRVSSPRVLIDILGCLVAHQDNHFVKKINSPERRSFRWRNNASYATYCGTNVGYEPGRVPRETSGSESDRIGESSSIYCVWPITIISLPLELLDVAEGLNYIHTNDFLGVFAWVGVFF